MQLTRRKLLQTWYTCTLLSELIKDHVTPKIQKGTHHVIFCYIFFCWFLCTWVADGATHFLGTDIGNPVSGSFFPLIAGSDSGSTPSFQSIHESRTDNITLKGAKTRLTQQSSMEYFKIIYFQEGFNNCARVKMFK